MFVTQPPGLVPARGQPGGPGAGPDRPGVVDDLDLRALQAAATWRRTCRWTPTPPRRPTARSGSSTSSTSSSRGRARSPTQCSPTRRGPSALAEFNRSGNSLSYGNLLTIPVGDELMYVEPVYAALRHRQRGELPDPALRAGLLQGRGRASATTLQRRSGPAIAEREEPDDRQPSDEPSTPSPTPSGTPTDEPPSSRSTGSPARSRTCSTRPQQEFVAGRRGPEGRRPGGVPGAHPEGPASSSQQALDRRGRRRLAVVADAPRRREPRPRPDLGRPPPCRNVVFTDAGWSSSVARWAHNPEVAGSNPAPATKFRRGIRVGSHA